MAEAQGRPPGEKLRPLDAAVWAEVSVDFEPVHLDHSALRTLDDAYGIGIFVPRAQRLDVEQGKLTGTRPSDSVVATVASALRDHLARYPRSFVQSLGFERVVLIEGGKHKGVPMGGFVMSPAGALFATPRLFSSQRGMSHELFHFIDYRLVSLQAGNWSALNRPGTQYGAGGRAVVAQHVGAAAKLQETRRDLPGFVSLYAMSAPEEDRAELFAVMVTQPSTARDLARSDAVIANKTKYILDTLDQISPGTAHALGF